MVVLMGARQTGKTTLVRSESALNDTEDRLYLTLDDLAVRERARLRPEDFVRSAPLLTLDEVQREPDLILAIKQAVDSDGPRRPGRFLLTGSANLLLMHRISESLAGRATYVTLWPLTRRERLGLSRAGLWDELLSRPVEDWYDLVRGQEVPVADWQSESRTGSYPTPAVELRANEQRAATRTRPGESWKNRESDPSVLKPRPSEIGWATAAKSLMGTGTPTLSSNLKSSSGSSRARDRAPCCLINSRTSGTRTKVS